MTKKYIQLGKKNIYPDSEPYIIAEIGVNHEGSFDLAKKLIDLAKEGGANAAKFQTYKADSLAAKESPSYWDTTKEKTQSQNELFKKYDSFNADDYLELSKYCEQLGIDFLSTPFDDDAINFLAPVMPFFKIASADITNLPFLKKIALKKKPIVLSTGASTIDEIDNAVKTIKQVGSNEIALLHCILNYPTPYELANLGMIKGMISKYGDKHIVGYSDHTLPDKNMSSLVTAYLYGAVIIEKHFTHDKSLPGNDHYHAMDVNDLKNFKNIINRIKISTGKLLNKEPIKSEEISRLNARRSIVLKSDMKKGDSILEKNITYKRPGTGISPVFWDKILGKKVSKNLFSDKILEWEDFED